MTAQVSKNRPPAKLVVVLGAGGVGKTTTAAALALSFAERGLRSVVITVDPAMRLAQALGLEALSNEPREVMRFDNGGRVSALWLDPRTAFDDLVRKYAGGDGAAERILNNRLFRIIQGQLGGIEEYLGVEKILSLGLSGDFDVCVLDTPPSRHALDFLESPRHLIRFFDDSVLNAFIREGDDGAPKASGGFFARLFQSGKQQAFDVFRGFLGKGFLVELSELLKNLKPVHGVFTDTAESIEAWVSAPSTRMVGVSLFEPYPLDEIRLIGLELEARELPMPHMLVLNKCLPASAPPPESELVRALGAPAARSLLERHAVQERLRLKLKETPLSSQALAEVLRHSGQDINRDHLLQMGRKILESWEPKDPGLFSKI